MSLISSWSLGGLYLHMQLCLSYHNCLQCGKSLKDKLTVKLLGLLIFLMEFHTFIILKLCHFNFLFFFVFLCHKYPWSQLVRLAPFNNDILLFGNFNYSFKNDRQFALLYNLKFGSPRSICVLNLVKF